MTATTASPAPRTLPLLVVAGAALAALLTFAIARSLGHAGFNVWAGLLVAAVIIAVSVPLILWVTRITREPDMAGLLILALVLKMAASMARYLLTFKVYGSADAGVYHRAGFQLAPLFRAGDFSVDVLGRSGSAGTRFLEILTGVVYVFTGPTPIGGFLVFTCLGFWGLFLCYRAFRIAVPNGDGRRYAMFLFFLPTALYWSSSIGKDAWMVLAIGVAAYGAARLLTGSAWGILPTLVGLVAASEVRAHIAALLGGALLVAMVVARGSAPRVAHGALRIGVIVVLLLGSAVVLAEVRSQLGTSSLSFNSIQKELEETAENSSEGGSRFTPAQVHTPLDFPKAAVTVLFRPLPYEAHNVTTLLAAAEGVFLLGLVVTSFRRFLSIPGLIRNEPYIAYAITFLVGFIIGFSVISNFGILTGAERVQVIPFLLVFVALPKYQSKAEREPRVRPVFVPVAPNGTTG